MAGKNRGRGKSGRLAEVNSEAARSSSASLPLAADPPYVCVKVFYVEESFNLTIDCPLDQSFDKLLPEAYRECVRVYNNTFMPLVPVSEGMLQLMPSGPVGEMSVKEWCEAGFYLLCRIDPDAQGGLLWEKQCAEERNRNTAFEGLLDADKKVSTSGATPSTGPVSTSLSVAASSIDTDNKQSDEYNGCEILSTRVLELEAKIWPLEAIIVKLEEKIAPLEAIVVKHNKTLRRICLDAAKAKIVELVKLQPDKEETWRHYLKKFSSKSMAAIRPPLSYDAWYLLDLGAQPLNWAWYNAPLYEVAAAVLDAPKRKDGWLELFYLGYGTQAWDALEWGNELDI